MKRIKRGSSFGVALLAAIVLSACGATTSSGQPAQPGAATGTPVKLGFINSTGGALSYPDKEAAVRAFVRDINAHGGLNNHPIDLDICNDKGEVQSAGLCARQMITDKVAAVVGSQAVQDQVVVPVLREAGIPIIGGGGKSAASLTSPNVYTLDAGTIFGYTVLTSYGIKKLNLQVVEVSNDSPGATGLRKTIDGQLAKGGMKFSGVVLVPPTAVDFGPIVQSAKKNGAGAATMLLPPSQLTLFLKAASDAGLDLKVFTPGFLDPTNPSQYGGAAELDRVLVALPYPLPYTPNPTNPVIKKFQANLAAELAAGDADAALNKQITSFSAWMAFYAFAQVVKQQKMSDFTSAGIVTALNAAQDVDLGGAIPPWTPNKPGPPGMERLSNNAYWISGYKNGEPYLITNRAVGVDEAVQGNF